MVLRFQLTRLHILTLSRFQEEPASDRGVHILIVYNNTLERGTLSYEFRLHHAEQYLPRRTAQVDAALRDLKQAQPLHQVALSVDGIPDLGGLDPWGNDEIGDISVNDDARHHQDDTYDECEGKPLTSGLADTAGTVHTAVTGTRRGAPTTARTPLHLRSYALGADASLHLTLSGEYLQPGRRSNSIVARP